MLHLFSRQALTLIDLCANLDGGLEISFIDCLGEVDVEVALGGTAAGLASPLRHLQRIAPR